MRGGVARVGAYGHFEGGPGLVELVLAGVKHGQVVVGLGQLRVVLRDFGESGDRVSRFAGFGLDHALDETHLWVARLGGQVLVGPGHGFSQLPGAHEGVHLGVIVGMCGRHAQGRDQSQQAQGSRQRLV